MKQKIKENEFSSKSELINDLIRRQREQEEERLWLRNERIKGENSGRTPRERYGKAREV